MEIVEFETLLASHGANPGRWPGRKAEDARALLETSEKARAEMAEAKKLDRLLDAVPADEFPGDLTARVLAVLPVAGGGLPFRRSEIMTVGISMAASLVIGVSMGLSDLGRTPAFYAGDDLLELSFGIDADDSDDSDDSIIVENEES